MNVADEIVVVDSCSNDKTEDICRKSGVRFFKQTFPGYREQKNFAIKKASYRHILSLDADEALSRELEKSILQARKELKNEGYTFNRMNNYCNTWIRHSNWYPDRKLRLFDSTKGEWKGINPHDKYILPKGSKIEHLKGDLLHWPIATYEEHIEKVNRFSSIAAREYFKLGRNVNGFSMIMHMVWRFIKAYLLRGGFMDGYNGFVISSLSAYSSFLKYLKLRQLHLEAGKEKDSGNKSEIKPAGE